MRKSGNTLLKIDIENLNLSIKIIEQAFSSGYFEKHINEISNARNLILDNYNLFSMLHDFCNNQYKESGKKVKVILKPEKFFTGNIKKKVRLYTKFLKNDLLKK